MTTIEQQLAAPQQALQEERQNEAAVQERLQALQEPQDLLCAKAAACQTDMLWDERLHILVRRIRQYI